MLPTILIGYGAVGAFWAVVFALGSNGTHQVSPILAFGGIAMMTAAVTAAVFAVKSKLTS